MLGQCTFVFRIWGERCGGLYVILVCVFVISYLFYFSSLPRAQASQTFEGLTLGLLSFMTPSPRLRLLILTVRFLDYEYATTPAMVMKYPSMPCTVTGFLKMAMETPAATTPLPLPKTCRVSAEVYRVTRKFSKFRQ